MRRRRYGGSDDDDGFSASSNDDDDDDNDSPYGEAPAQLAIRDKEEAWLQSALRRINRARSKGKADVKLSKEELEALERRRRRMLEEEERKKQEEERKKRGSGSGSERKKKKEQRIAVPLSHLEPVSRKKRSATQSYHPPPPIRDDALPRHVSAEGALENQQHQVYPPMGYFAPPSTSRSRPRSGTTSSGPPSRSRDERGSSPLQYEYMSHPAATSRVMSDSIARPRSSRGSPREEASSSLGSRSTIDPFMYQTEGPRVAYSAGSAATSRRYVSGPPEMAYSMRRGVPLPPASRSHEISRRQSYGDETSDDDSATSEESSSDGRGNGAQIREPVRESMREPVREPTGRGRDMGIVVEVSPERAPELPKKKSSSPVKRKPVSGGRRKKR